VKLKLIVTPLSRPKLFPLDFEMYTEDFIKARDLINRVELPNNPLIVVDLSIGRHYVVYALYAFIVKLSKVETRHTDLTLKDLSQFSLQDFIDISDLFLQLFRSERCKTIFEIIAYILLESPIIKRYGINIDKEILKYT
jgi:hypothetical protein